MIAYQEALEASIEYFGGNKLAAQVWIDKYALRDKDDNLLEKTPDDMHHRIAREFARIEKGKFKEPLSEERIYGLIRNFTKIIPQGSPMYGIGNREKFVTLSNCYVLEPPYDSYGGIHRTDQHLTQISKRRGGTGINISNLRPALTPTQNSSKSSTGVVSFAKRFSHSIREVAQNGRRGALMISCDIAHPESISILPEGQVPQPIVVNPNMEDKGIRPIHTTTEWYDPNSLDFATMKYDRTQVTGANVSLMLRDAFMNAVVEDREYVQKWPVDSDEPKITKKINARKAWKKIIRAAWETAEPGLLFWDTILRESPADCYAAFGYRTIGTNPCSELGMCEDDSCRLLLLNLIQYVKNKYTEEAYFDYNEFYEDCKIAQRLLDDMIDLELECIDRIIDKIENDPEPANIKQVELELWKAIREKCVNGRRTGLGPTALGDTIAALGIKYGSEESIKVTEKIYQTMKFGSYRSSVDMAKELGPFKVWDWELEKNNPFISRLKYEAVFVSGVNKDTVLHSAIDGHQLYQDIKKYGRRNIANLTSAPAGSTSLVANLMDDIFGVSSGIEPVFQIASIRKKKGNPGDANFRVDETDSNGDAWMHFTVYHPGVEAWQRATGKTDPAESPFFGACAEDIDWTKRVELQAAAQRHVDHSISSTINLPEDVSEEKVAEIYETAWRAGCKGITVYRKGCRTGVIVDIDDKSKTRVPKTVAPARPKKLSCDVHHIKVKGQEYFVLVGMMENDPYEVFAGRNGFISKKVKRGEISKIRGGYYKVVFDDGETMSPITSACSEEEEAITRLVSTALRHGADIHMIVQQLEKVNGDMVGFARSICRALKKYIKDGVKEADSCPDCQQNTLIRQNGCIQCQNCGHSKCM